MVVTELHVSSHIIPWEHVLPDVDPRGLTAGRAKALLRQKLCISSRGLELLLGGWLPLLEDQNVQDLYARYHQTAVLQSDGTFCTIIYDSCLHESAEVAFDVDTGRLFYNARKKPAAKKLRDEDELAPLCVLDKLVLQIRTTQSRLPSQNLPWGGTGGTVVALVFGPTHDVTSVFTLTSINKSTTIEGLQSLILEETGIEPKAQYLRVVGGKFIDTSALTNRKLCWQQGIKSGSFLAVEKFWPGQIQIFCKTLSGATRTLRCYDNILVEDLKKQVEELEPVPAKAQRLIYAGQDLLDGRTLRDSKIQTEATVQLVLRLLGGVYYTSSDLDLEQLRALTTDLKVKMFRSGVCINERTIRIDGTTEARQLSEILAGLHSATVE